MSNRKQKNLRLDEEYHEKLENMAEEMFNSKKKQGQVVERLIDLHQGEDMLGMIEDIHTEIVESESAHTQSNTDSEPDSTVDSKLVEKVENREAIDPTEWDLTVFKGDTEMVVNAGISVLKHEKGDTDTISKKEVMNIVQSQFDYSINAARQKRDLILDEIGTVLPTDGILDKLVEQEIEVGLNKKPNGNKDHFGKPNEFREQYKSLSDYIETDVGFDVYVLDRERYEQMVISQLQHKLEDESGKQIGLRINSVLAEFGYEIGDEPVILDY